MPVVTARVPALTLAQVWSVLAWALPALAALLAVMPAVDLAYQLRAGGEILDSRAIPTVDTWTFTVPGTAWTDQQWGAQVLLAVAYRLGGWTGLALLRAGLVALTCWLLARLVAIRAPRLGAMGRTLLVLAAFTVMATALALRPQLFAIPLFVLTLVLLADRSGHPRGIWAIPVITLAWANLHGSFPLVFVLLGLGLLGELLDRRDPRPLGVVTLASVAATLLNPFGLGVWGYVLRISTNSTIASRVSEWRPPSLTDPAGAVFWLSIVAVVGFLALRAWRRRRMDPSEPLRKLLPGSVGLLTLVGFGLFGAITGRGIAWWPPAALFVLAPLIAALAAERRPGQAPSGQARPARRARRNSALLGVMLVAGIALLPLWRPVGPAGVPLGTLSHAPQGIASFLDARIAPEPNCPHTTFSGCPGEAEWRTPIWAPQVWGSWLELAVPQALVPLDSRIELYPDSLWRVSDSIATSGLIAGGGPSCSDLPRRCDIAYWVTQAGVDGPIEAALRASPRWQLLYSDADGSVWGRR